jgi:hypothetical protein
MALSFKLACASGWSASRKLSRSLTTMTMRPSLSNALEPKALLVPGQSFPWGVLYPSPPSDTTQPRARTTQCSTHHLPQATHNVCNTTTYTHLADHSRVTSTTAVARYHFRMDQSTRSRATTTSKRRCPTTSSGGTSPTAHRQPSRHWTSFSAVASRRSGSQVGGYRTTRHLGSTEGWCPT